MGRYVALRMMQVQGDDGHMMSVAPGEEVPNFASWSYPVQKAHLDLGNVRDNAKLAPTLINGRVVMATQPFGATELVVQKEPEQPTMTIRCPSCDHSGFATKAAYKRHFLRVHRGH